MEMNSSNKKNSTFTLSFCSLMAALGSVIMLSAGLIPVLTYCSPLLAAVLLVPVLREYGPKWAWSVWTVTSILSAILCADKEAAFFYIFLGWYPIVKPRIDLAGLRRGAAAGQRRRAARRLLPAACKFIIFAAAIAAMYGLLLFVIGYDAGFDELAELGRFAGLIFCAGLVLVMMLYDVVLGRFMILYEYRLRGRLKFLK